MDPARSTSPGFVHALRTLGDGLIASVEGRLELFTVELQEEKFRLIQTFIWISAAVFSAMMALTFASLTLVYLCWDTARLFVLGGLALLYAAALVAIIVTLRRYLARQPSPFATTRQEMEKDRACIRNPS